AAGGPGLLEVDVNPTPLRDEFGDLAAYMRGGNWHLPDLSGLGINALPEGIATYETLHREARA
ncbi:MAG: mandelate racemase/muconate lactonizing enzyme family protein, partial [Paracoccus sp. (in: a-proteobacteria)]|nr:mandelate racemase/muconate lactonizing enzyme family protein [Paracoccus sp. (in: a-proteobacteria)]